MIESDICKNKLLSLEKKHLNFTKPFKRNHFNYKSLIRGYYRLKQCPKNWNCKINTF